MCYAVGMKNRAKCKLCKTIIEPISDYDYVSCKCGEIAVEGANSLKVFANDLINVIRVDDMGNEIIPVIKEKPSDTTVSEDIPPTKPTKAELIDMLDEMRKNIEKLPQHALTGPINHYDFMSLLMLLSEILRSE